jgi:hypothetical protein
MIKKTVTFEDYEGNTHTEDFWFNLTKAELMEIEVSEKGGFAEAMQVIIAKEDGQKIIAAFKKILLMSIGERRSATDFRKNDEIREAFESSPAFSEIFMSLALDAQLGAEFVKGVMPANLAKQIDENQLKLPDVPEVPVSQENLENVIAAAQTPDFASMTPEEFETWKATNA